MGADQYHRWDEFAASALEWWVDAGVDTLVADEIRNWLAPPARPVAASPGPVVVPVANGPDSYAAFWDWRLGDDAPERHWSGSILPPEGPRDADLLVILDQPNGDSLMGGAEGALFDNILAAIGRSRSDVLIAGLAMARPLADALSPDSLPALAAATGRLLALTPARTALFVGHTTNRVLLEADSAPASRGLHGINRGGRQLQSLAIAHPRFMMKHPQAKREAWRCLQSFLGGQA